MIEKDNRVALPTDPLRLTQTGTWPAFDPADSGITVVSGTGDDTQVNLNFNNMFRIINSQHKIIVNLMKEMRESGYDK